MCSRVTIRHVALFSNVTTVSRKIGDKGSLCTPQEDNTSYVFSQRTSMALRNGVFGYVIVHA